MSQRINAVSTRCDINFASRGAKAQWRCSTLLHLPLCFRSALCEVCISGSDRVTVFFVFFFLSFFFRNSFAVVNVSGLSGEQRDSVTRVCATRLSANKIVRCSSQQQSLLQVSCHVLDQGEQSSTFELSVNYQRTEK